METGNTHLTEQELDLASLQSVRNFTSFYTDGNTSAKVYCLVCNAGISPAHTGETADGLDLVFQTNYLLNFLLVNLLLPCMQPDGKILVVSSDMHNPPGCLEWKSPLLLAHDTSCQRYSYSKLCDLHLVYELARRLKENGSRIRVDAFNPGFMQTGFTPANPAHAAMVKATMPDRVGGSLMRWQSLSLPAVCRLPPPFITTGAPRQFPRPLFPTARRMLKNCGRPA